MLELPVRLMTTTKKMVGYDIARTSAIKRSGQIGKRHIERATSFMGEPTLQKAEEVQIRTNG